MAQLSRQPGLAGATHIMHKGNPETTRCGLVLGLDPLPECVRCTAAAVAEPRFRVEQLDELVAAGEPPVTSDAIPIQRNRIRSKH
jgi:hypothetical protein